MEFETKIQHHQKVTVPKGNHPVVSPIYQSGKFTFDKMSDLRKLIDGKAEGFLYTRYGNPTTRELEILLATMQQTEDCFCFASGVGAISNTLLSLLSSGDRLLLFWESYKPTRYLAKNTFRRFGIETSFMSLQDSKTVQQKIQSWKPNVILFESPTNPCLSVPDIHSICTAAQKVGAITVLDNTFAGPLEHRGWPIDLYIHSLSKHLSGHSDVIAGAVAGRRDIIDKHRFEWIQLGASLDPHAAYLVLRGIKSFQVRMERQCENAMELARVLASDIKGVCNVRYPGLDSHPQHTLAREQMKSFGQVIAFDLEDQTQSALDHFIDRLDLFSVTGSIGSTESLVAPAELFYGGDLSEEERKVVGISPSTVRLSIGLESVKDLAQDIKQALR